ncbi:MAG: multicopper oxidase domain-containing protein [Fibrobacteria bacterium]
MNRRSALTWVAAPFLLLSGCFKDEASPSGPAAGSPFVSKYVPVTREYWITTETTFKWDMVPDGESMMTKDVIHPERRYLYKTIRYVQTESSGIPIKAPEWRQLSGPIISATVGDSVVVHFRNGANTGMPLSIHPHNLVYDEANEGVWRKDRPLVWPDNGTAGGSVQPGDKFTYRWKAEEKSVGVGPYHSHSFSPAEEVSMGLIGTIIVDNPPDHPDYVKFDTTISLVFKSYLAMVSPVDTGNAHTVKKDTCSPPLIPWNGGCHPKEHVPKDQWPENIVDSMAHGGGPEVQTINGLAFANLKGLSFKKGANVRFVVFAMNDEGNQNHTAHFHGEMLREMSRRNLYKDVFDLPSAVALDLMLKAEHVGKWMLHCHVEHHAAEMMATYEITE